MMEFVALPQTRRRTECQATESFARQETCHATKCPLRGQCRSQRDPSPPNGRLLDTLGRHGGIKDVVVAQPVGQALRPVVNGREF